MTYVVYQPTEKERLGSELANFMTMAERWPESLHTYYEGLTAKEKSTRRGKVLVIWMLQDWMAQETGLDILRDQRFEKLLRRYSQWDSNPDTPAGDNFILMNAIAHCGICFDEHGERITDANDLVKFMLGLPIPSPTEKAQLELQRRTQQMRLDD